MKNPLSQLTFIFLLFFTLTLKAPESLNSVIFWNIGQGQWVTHALFSECIHYDIGGESLTSPKILISVYKLCATKKNTLFLSHSDLDHRFFLKWAKKNLNLTLSDDINVTPQANTKVNNRKLIFNGQFSSKNRNLSSKVFSINGFLFPGDSTTKAEKIWSQHPALKNIKVLLLGHHGSRTSTSQKLLAELPSLQQAVVQARFKKYKHPHEEVLIRLKQKKIPLLQTEKWGTLQFNLLR